MRLNNAQKTVLVTCSIINCNRIVHSNKENKRINAKMWYIQCSVVPLLYFYSQNVKCMLVASNTLAFRFRLYCTLYITMWIKCSTTIKATVGRHWKRVLERKRRRKKINLLCCHRFSLYTLPWIPNNENNSWCSFRMAFINSSNMSKIRI